MRLLLSRPCCRNPARSLDSFLQNRCLHDPSRGSGSDAVKPCHTQAAGSPHQPPSGAVHRYGESSGLSSSFAPSGDRGSLKRASGNERPTSHDETQRHRRRALVESCTRSQRQRIGVAAIKISPLHASYTTSAQDIRSPKAVQIADDKAYIALGSNVGDRLAKIDEALVELNREGIRVTRTSALYETSPMYVEDQDTFYNAVCEVQIPSGLTPLGLLDKVKEIENRLGRVKTVEKGPRAIDLDILAFGRQTVSHERLSVPHHSMLEREFVLRPLADLIPNCSLPEISAPGMTVLRHLGKLSREFPTSIFPLRASIPILQPGSTRSKTQIMGVLNMTPDSFSDGGRNSLNPESDQMQHRLSAWLAAGATIIDIGGQSTAPKAPSVSAEEELGRVIPLIKHIRSQSRYDGIALSVDTYRASVARAAVQAGADIVNDVSAGKLDAEMLPTVAQLRVPIIMMHMRGDPSTMMKLCDYPMGLIPTIAQELESRVHAAMAAGIPRWRIILDPGIGFSKQRGQNIEVLRGMRTLMDREEVKGFPWLVGTSRKAFLGHILGVKKADERDWGTAAAVTAAVAAGTQMVRIHNESIAQTVAVADAIWRDTHKWK